MSTAALVTLLIVLEESRGKQAPPWWSQQVFDKRSAISKTWAAKALRHGVRMMVTGSRVAAYQAGGRAANAPVRMVRMITAVV